MKQSVILSTAILIVVMALLPILPAEASTFSSFSPRLAAPSSRVIFGEKKKGQLLKVTCNNEFDNSKQPHLALLVPRGGGEGVMLMQDPPVKNELFGTPNTLNPLAYPALDAFFTVAYFSVILAMPGGATDLHKLIHIAFASVHVLLAYLTSYGVKASFPNHPKLPLKIMYAFDMFFVVTVSLLPLFLDQGSKFWNVFWHAIGASLLVFLFPFLDYNANNCE
mmetsp:Transcript_253/g.478  ORF Transcript_253/g.478 Transcript_253/m.478 type:complete len:222 (-) Transcript_253:638-1303(-)|eukprot:CAMPEP_0183709530 /NCGR_PEP_ID=MMETSP0737-20130205/5562_1 /TAXON_ID=385413 /ORGANISM="Thalassiosira miniscula, Strain CCMP1093" /LENGTH=221 /DNA_ID=CAMNT_0025937655 /DNA_START=21 /DNA_END=686 /DNA_ORIENTATION=-